MPAQKTVSVQANLRIAGAMVMDQNNTDFPLNPKLGTLLIKGSALYAYMLVGAMETWYPLISLPNTNMTYVHTQAGAALEWVVNHNLDTTQYWYQIQDTAGNLVSELARVPVDTNTFKLQFSEAFAGTVIVVSTATMFTDKVVATSVKVGNVIIDSTGVYMSGVSIANSADTALAQIAALAPVASTGSYTDLTNKPAAVSAFVNDLQFQSLTDVNAAIQAVVGAAPAALNTLVEIANQLALDETAASALTNSVTALQASVNTALAGDVVSVKTFTGAVTCNYTTDGTYIAANVTGATTLTIAGVPDASHAYGMTFELTNAGANITWPASVSWLGGTAPTLRASGISMVTLVTRNGGTTWYGSAA